MQTTSDHSHYLRISEHSATLLVNQLSLARAENNQAIFKFGFGQSPFPVPEKICQALAESVHHKEYMSVQGHLPLREAITSFHYEREGKNWHSDDIIIGAGSKILLFCVMAAFESAEILLPAPSWVSYEPQAKLAGHKTHWLTTSFAEKWKINAQQLEQFCKDRENPDIPLLLILNYPSNPSGQTYDKSELLALAEVMRKYNIIVIADEIYSLLNFQQDQASIADYYPEGCIVSSGLSKWCGAGGWRLGFMHIPPQLTHLLATVIGVASETYSCAPSPIQIAATHAYQEKDLADQFIALQTKVFAQISHYCVTELQAVGVKVHDAQGGFYLFPDFSNFQHQLSSKGIHTSEQLTNAIIAETGVALLAGSAFGMDQFSLTARLAFVDFEGKQISNNDHTELNYDRVKTGIKELCQWLSDL